MALYHLRKSMKSHLANIYANDKLDIILLNKYEGVDKPIDINKISKINYVNIVLDYGGSCISNSKLIDAKITKDFTLTIRKESFFQFRSLLKKNQLFERTEDFFVFNTMSTLPTFAYIPENIANVIKEYDFDQFIPEVNEHMIKFNYAMGDIKEHFAKQDQKSSLNQVSSDLEYFIKNNKGNKDNN